MPPCCKIQKGCIYRINYPLSGGNPFLKLSFYQATKFLIIEQTTIFQRPAVWPWLLTMWPEHQQVVSSTLWMHELYQDWQLYSKEVKRYWNKKSAVWPWPPLGIQCTKFGNFEGKSKKIFSRHHRYKDQQFDLDFWPYDLKINRTIYSLGESTVLS